MFGDYICHISIRECKLLKVMTRNTETFVIIKLSFENGRIHFVTLQKLSR